MKKKHEQRMKRINENRNNLNNFNNNNNMNIEPNITKLEDNTHTFDKNIYKEAY